MTTMREMASDIEALKAQTRLLARKIGTLASLHNEHLDETRQYEAENDEIVDSLLEAVSDLRLDAILTEASSVPTINPRKSHTIATIEANNDFNLPTRRQLVISIVMDSFLEYYHPNKTDEYTTDKMIEMITRSNILHNGYSISVAEYPVEDE